MLQYLCFASGQSQVFEDSAIHGRAPGACGFAAAHEGAQASLQLLQLDKCLAHLLEMGSCDVTDFQTGPLRRVNQTDQLSHLTATSL